MFIDIQSNKMELRGNLISLIRYEIVVGKLKTKISQSNTLKAYRLSEWNFFFMLKVGNIRCYILIAVEIFHNIIRK